MASSRGVLPAPVGPSMSRRSRPSRRVKSTSMVPANGPNAVMTSRRGLISRHRLERGPVDVAGARGVERLLVGLEVGGLELAARADVLPEALEELAIAALVQRGHRDRLARGDADELRR